MTLDAAKLEDEVIKELTEQIEGPCVLVHLTKKEAKELLELAKDGLKLRFMRENGITEEDMYIHLPEKSYD